VDTFKIERNILLHKMMLWGNWTSPVSGDHANRHTSPEGPSSVEHHEPVAEHDAPVTVCQGLEARPANVQGRPQREPCHGRSTWI